eukprot:103380_1
MLHCGDDVGALVLDVGSSLTKCGYAGEDTPKVLFNTAVGVIESEGKSSEDGDVEMNSSGKTYFCGQNLNFRRDEMDVVSPVKNGLVEDWDAVERVWDHAIRGVMQLNPKEHPILMIENTFTDDERREKMLERAFETLEAPAVFVAKDAVLTSFAVGRSTSLVVDCGAGMTRCVPVHEGYALTRAARRTRVAGNYMDEVLLKQLTNRKIDVRPNYTVKKCDGAVKAEFLKFPKTSESYFNHFQMNVVRDIKHSVCAVSPVKFESASGGEFETKQYELPDGTMLDLGAEQFLMTEPLFSPGQVSSDLDTTYTFEGLPKMVIDSVSGSDLDIRRELYAAVVVTGGGSRISGLSERLHQEIMGVLPPALNKLKVIQPSTAVECKSGAWIGGSILGCLGSFQQMWISKEQYSEHGAKIVHDKCP